jgi:hypothetical protein
MQTTSENQHELELFWCQYAVYLPANVFVTVKYASGNSTADHHAVVTASHATTPT